MLRGGQTTSHDELLGGIWRRGKDLCPRCAYTVAIPLKPTDSKTSSYVCLWCPRCHYTWWRDQPLSESETA